DLAVPVLPGVVARGQLRGCGQGRVGHRVVDRGEVEFGLGGRVAFGDGGRCVVVRFGQGRGKRVVGTGRRRLGFGRRDGRGIGRGQRRGRILHGRDLH